MPGFFIVVLLGGFFDKLALFIKGLKKACRSVVMNLVGSAGIDVEGDAKLHEGILDHPVVFINDLLRGNPLPPRLNGNWNAMLVGPANKNNIFSLQPKIPCIYVSRNINPCKVADVQWPIGIWKG